MVARRRGVIVPLLLALAARGAPAEDKPIDLQEALRALLANALEVQVAARVVPSDEQPIWNAESRKLTLPGRPIKVRLDGENARIDLICTPYMQDSGEVLLLAQGQVWLSQSPESEVKYFNTFYSIPVTFGETVLFFPLGVSSSAAAGDGSFNIELEIKVVPYKAPDPEGE